MVRASIAPHFWAVTEDCLFTFHQLPRCHCRGGANVWRRLPTEFTNDVNAEQHFRRFCSALRAIEGYEAMHMIRRGHGRRVAKGDIQAQLKLGNALFRLTV